MSFYKIRPRAGTAAQWQQANTVLAEREIGYELPAGGLGTGPVRMKMGDGATPWNDLEYADPNSTPTGDYLTADNIVQNLEAEATNKVPSAAAVRAEFDAVNDGLKTVKTYVDEDGKLHFVDSEGADSVLPFSNTIKNIYHFSNIASGSNQTAPIDYKCIILEASTASPMTAFSINDTSCFSEFINGESNSNGQRLFLNRNGKSGDVLKGTRSGSSTFSILLIN